MMYFLKATLALALLTFTLSPREAAASAAGVSGAMPAILRANGEWAAAMKSGDADAIAKPYAADAVFVTAAGESIRGRDAIRAFYRARLDKATVVFASIHHQGTAAGAQGLVYEWGTGTVGTRSASGAVVTAGGPYLTVWKRDEAGVWKIFRNVVL